MIFSKAFPQEIENQLREMFSDTGCLERRDFTMLHRIVLGLVGKDLTTELQASTKYLNTQDSSGRTALLMAAVRNDVEAVKLLLEYGADPNIISSDQGSPLHFAALARGPCCIAPLLAHDALVDSTTSWRQTALHYVAAYRNDERPARLLLGAGADLNARDLNGITPLQWAIVSGSEKVARVLLEQGADVNNIDKYNNTALLSALTAHRHDILDMLLDYGISLKGLYVKGGTILHEIASSADIESMKILQRLDLSHISLDTLDDQGLTALDLFQSRTDQSTELADAFSQLSSSSGPAVLRTMVDSGSGEFMAPDPRARVALPERAPGTGPVHQLESSRNTIAAIKRTLKGMDDAGKLLRGLVVNTKLQRDALFIALLGIVIAMLCRSI
jgi:ankyrin repeat protein